MSKTYERNGETYYDAHIKNCDECGRDWMLRPKTQWENGHCLLAFVADIFGNSWVLCNRCFKHEAKHYRDKMGSPLWVTAYIKKKEEEEDEE